MPGRMACVPSPPPWGPIIAACGWASAIPARSRQVTGHVLANFSKDDIAWLAPLVDAMVDAAPLLAKDDDAGFMSKVALLTAPVKPKKEPKEKDA